MSFCLRFWAHFRRLERLFWVQNLKKITFKIEKKEEQSYSYNSQSLFEIQLKNDKDIDFDKSKYVFRDRKKKEYEVYQKFIKIDKENKQDHNMKVENISLGKRNSDQVNLNSKSKFINSKSILNLNKISNKVKIEKDKISEFPIYPKRKRRKRKNAPKFEVFENSVRIRNLVEDKSGSKKESQEIK